MFVFPSGPCTCASPSSEPLWSLSATIWARWQRAGSTPGAKQRQRKPVPTILFLELMNNSDHCTVWNYGTESQSWGICFNLVNPQERKSPKQKWESNIQKEQIKATSLCLKGLEGLRSILICGWAWQDRTKAGCRLATQGMASHHAPPPAPLPVITWRWMKVPLE